MLLVYADFEPDRLVTLAKAAKDYQSTTYKQHVIHNWIDDKKKAKDGVKPRVYAAIQGGRIVVFAQQEARVAQALDVLDRAAPNLAGSGGVRATGRQRQHELHPGGGPQDWIFPTRTPNAAMFRLAKAARLQVGEAQGQLKATLNLEAGRRGGGEADGLGRAGAARADEAAEGQPRLGQACRGALAQAGWRGRGGHAGRPDRRAPSS